MSDLEEKTMHKNTMRRMANETRYAYIVGYVGGEVKSDWPTPAKKLRHIRLLIQAFDELQAESE